VTSSVTWPFDSQVAISYSCSIGTIVRTSSRFRDRPLMGPKYTWVMTLTFLSQVMSSVMWPLESQWSISYWWSIGTKSVYPAVFETDGNKHIGLMTLTFQGHVTSSVTWPFDSQVAISYRCSIGTKFVSPAQPFFRWAISGLWPWLFYGSLDVISHVTIWIPICHFLLVVHLIQISISNGILRYRAPNLVCP